MRSLRRIAFGDDCESGFPGCLRDSGFDENAFTETKKSIRKVIKRAKEGKQISKSEVWTLCNIVDELHQYDDKETCDALEEIMDLIEGLFDKPIKSFRGKNGFLSNYYQCNVLYDGIMYKSAEAAFQAQKCEAPEDRKKFANLTAPEAKKLGRKIKLRDSWEHDKYYVMEKIVKAKFDQNPDLAKLLVDTGDAPLIEGNSWGDTTWGVDSKTGIGGNNLGIILMDTRDNLKE